MKNIINWNSLTPAVFAIAVAQNRDVGVARSMVEQNLKAWDAVNTGAENLPAEFCPEWDQTGDYNAWERIMQAHYAELTELWNAKDYQGMIDLMNKSTDPGEISGVRPGEESQDNHQ